MSSNHPFDEAIALQAQPDGSWLGETSPAWANMIGPYGGITAAQSLNAILQHPDRLGDPVAFTVNFAAALADGPFVAHAKAARTNRSTQHWVVDIQQDGQSVATATAVTAVRRETWSAGEAAIPMVPRPSDVPRTLRRGVEWLHRYDMRFIEGSIPRSWSGEGGPKSLSRLWVRDDPPRPLDFASLTAMADVFFPRIWLRRAQLVPLGTVTMTVYYHADARQLAHTGDGFLLLQAQGQGFRNGYFDHSGQLWNEAGELLATTHQVVYFKE